MKAATWRRRCRALLRQHNVPCEAGDCHEAAYALTCLLRAQGWYARRLSGWLAQQPRRRRMGPPSNPTEGMTHSWVEVRDRQWRWLVDPTLGQLAAEEPGTDPPALGVYPMPPVPARATRIATRRCQLVYQTLRSHGVYQLRLHYRLHHKKSRARYLHKPRLPCMPTPTC